MSSSSAQTQAAPSTPALRSAYDHIVGQDIVELAIWLTIFLQIAVPKANWYEYVVYAIVGGCAFIYPPLARTPGFWLVLGGIRLLHTLALGWDAAGDVEYLLSYWSIALGCALMLPDPRQAVATTARLLIGLAFLFAVAWKLTSPEYTGGGAFCFLFYSDDRFLHLAQYLGGDGDSLQTDYLRTIQAPLRLPAAISLEHRGTLLRIAQSLAWGVLLFETCLALLFLWRDSPRIAKWRSVLLLAFSVTACLLLDRFVFAWTVLLIGLVQIPDSIKKTRFAYLLVMIVAAALWEDRLEMLLRRLFG